MKNLFFFLGLLFALMGLGLFLHLQVNLVAKIFIIQSYCINTSLALAALLLLGWGINKKKSNLAVLYLVTVALKFCAYFLFFYPKFHWDGELNRQEFFIFFAPYSLWLLMEIIFLARRYK
jgi:hypothetical protein